MAKLCINCGKYPVFSHDRCKYCQSSRTDKKWLQKVLKQYKKGNVKPKIKQVSDKQSKKLQKYEQAKKEKEQELKQIGEWRCIFCGVPFGEDERPAGFHHLKGRDSDLVFDKKYIYPVHNYCHIIIYHWGSYALLSSQRWYKGFLERIKEIDIRIYNKEIRKGEK
jgi:hypothetical protein